MKQIDRLKLKKSRARKTFGAGVMNHMAARVLVAEEEAAEAAANQKKMAKSAAFWKREALRERERAKRVEAYREKRDIHRKGPKVRSLTRERLIKALHMLGSDQAENRASAALVAEKQRLMLGKSWNELIENEHEDFVVEVLKDLDNDDLYDMDDDLADDEEPVA
ncbi:hypothetical protein CT676_27610 [Bradyrhizobium sp. MOS001]|uniref:hypothetical protein n=1 Tax=Bradyrhizobium sp. MOS001 TaxID=2133948 RepID=UPI0010754A0D|nr:hypothetical protein [Bradyrhizobium sp. MOS001]TFW57965.1 hypothetical protein CT676_27610 [Bradyrhizobium sp. MOS001]